MRNAQKPDHVGLNTLLNRLREGRFVIPNFQREFEWEPWDIRELTRSIFLDYYVGSLLLWKSKQENVQALSCESIYGFAGEANEEYIVLDGQQRLTALYYAFVAPSVPLPNRSSQAFYFVRVDRFMAEEYDDAFDYEWTSKRVRDLLDDKNSQFATHYFPLSVIGAGGWNLFAWVQEYEQFWRHVSEDGSVADEVREEARLHAVNARKFGEHLKGLTEEYQISYIELSEDLPLDKVCDIFTKINSRGVRLDVFDLINALLVPKGLVLKSLWRDAQPQLEFVDTDRMNVYILQVMSILRQGYCSPKYLYYLLPGQKRQLRNPDGTQRTEVLVPDAENFQMRWKQAVSAIVHAIKLLRHPQEFGAVSSRYLPYVSIIPVFSALQMHAKNCPPALQLDAQRKIRHWYWASLFTNRYSGSVESTSARDFHDLVDWIQDDEREPALIEEFKHRFRSLDLRREVKRGSSIYNGIFNLLVIRGARDWVSGTIPQHGDLDDHHIVPRSWGVQNLEGNIVNTILNRTPLTSDTNRKVISDKLPNQYLPEMIAQNGEREVNAILETHFISRDALNILLRDPFTPADFEEFITERQRTLQDAIETLLVKERLDLPPDLRELDAAIEAIELKLRQTIIAVLENDAERLPPHVIQKVDERIQRASKKNAAMDAERYRSLDGRFEYFDLRELQDSIVSKVLWPEFEPRFANKVTLASKFDQLAELRNGIRHSRKVDEVTRKEGEASIIWFETVLGKPVH